MGVAPKPPLATIQKKKIALAFLWGFILERPT